MDILSFLWEYKFVILFYLIIIILIRVFRKKFEIQARFIALFRTKIGLKIMDKISKRHREFIRILGYIGIGIGYAGMLVIVYFIIYGLYNLIFVPSAPATMSLVLPGVKVPGSPIFIPFWYGIISLFIVILVHEFSHGIVARAHNLPVKSSGLVMFGPLPGAFVEPDEKKLRKSSDVVQYSVFAAGPFSNIILAVIILLLSALVVAPLLNSTVGDGFRFSEIKEEYPAYAAGLQPDVVYTYVNGEYIKDGVAFMDSLKCAKPGDTLIIGNDEINHTLVLTTHPDDPEKGYLGVVGIKNGVVNAGMKLWNLILSVIFELFKWIFMLSLGIGLANLLPLGPVDGGRMLQVSLKKELGEKKGNAIWLKISWYCFIVILILLLVPIIKSILKSMIGM